jgi:DNA primase
VAGFIPEHVLERVRQGNDIVEVIGSYFPLKRAGANFRALCPFHKEKTPSFNVSPSRQIWHCFGCGAGGNVFTFVMKYENLDFVSAVRRLAERAGIEIEFERGGSEPGRDQKQLLLDLHEQVAEFYHHNLMKEPAGEIARQYLKRRGIALQAAKSWQLGYSPEAWEALIEWGAKRKFSPELLEAAGLAVRGERGWYDRFRGRLMFPIRDEQGRVVGFSGRILTESKEQPKYINSPETAIFQKGRVLFALDRARRAITERNFAIVCEGQLDTIACHEAGLKNAVAPQGTALTEQHARILKRFADEVVLMFDADSAGEAAVVRSAEPLLAAGVVIRVVVLPEGHDPDSFLKTAGAAELEKLVTKAPGFFVYVLDRVSQLYDLGSDRDRLRAAEQVVELLAKIPNAILQAGCVRLAAERLDVPESAILQELRKLRARARPEPATAEAGPAAAGFARAAGSAAEEALLGILLSEERLMETVEERLDRAWLSDSVAAALIRKALQLYAQGQWRGTEAFVASAPDEESAAVLAAVLARPAGGERGEEAVARCLAALERRWLEGRLTALRKRLQQQELDDSEIMELQKQVLDLRRKLDHIAPLSMAKQTVSPRL